MMIFALRDKIIPNLSPPPYLVEFSHADVFFSIFSFLGHQLARITGRYWPAPQSTPCVYISVWGPAQ